MYKNKTWECVQKPIKAKVVGLKWIFKRKEDLLGIEEPRYKAKLVVKGFTHTGGIDYNEIFSSVVRHSFIRLLLSATTFLDMHLEQLNVKTAFLHRELEEVIDMQPPGSF